MSDQWSDAKKWRMDLAKNAVSFSVAAVLSLFVLDRVQEQRAQDKARADSFYSTRLKSLEDFRTATVAYDLAAHIAYTDLYEWKTRIKTPAMLRYEQEAYPRWFLSLETVQHLFPKQASDIQALTILAAQRHNLYDTLVDERLDSKEPTKPIDPWAKRVEFNQLGGASREARAKLIAKLQSSLFPQNAE